MNKLKGDEITIEEMPQGCVIHKNNNTIVISSIYDAKILSESLKKMINIHSQCSNCGWFCPKGKTCCRCGTINT